MTTLAHLQRHLWYTCGHMLTQQNTSNKSKFAGIHMYHKYRPHVVDHKNDDLYCELTGLNRTWVSADLSARRTFGRPKVRFNPYPTIFLAEKTAESPRFPAGRSAGRKSGLSPPPPPPCVCTAFCVYRLACRPLNNMTPAAATGRLLCVPPCVCTAFCVYRLACGPLNNMTQWPQTAFCVHHLVCAPPSLCTALPVAPQIT